MYTMDSLWWCDLQQSRVMQLHSIMLYMGHVLSKH